MKVDPVILKFLLESMNEGVREMHHLLRGPASLKTLQAMARIAHKLRGEATVVGLANLSQLVISLEDTLVRLQDQNQVKKSAWQPIAIGLLKIVKVCEHIRKSAEQSRLSKELQFKGQQKPQIRPPSMPKGGGVVASLQILALNVSHSCGKQVGLNLEKFRIEDVPVSMQAKVQDIVIQLVRNAIAHGVEEPEKRKSLGKNIRGSVSVSTEKMKGGLQVTVRDNGGGIRLEEVRRRLVIKYNYDIQRVANMSQQDLIDSLFLPGFSTLDYQSQHAGRGVGLDLVKEHVNSLGAAMEVSYKENVFTQFAMRIPLKEKTTRQQKVTQIKSRQAKRIKKFNDGIPVLTEIAN